MDRNKFDNFDTGWRKNKYILKDDMRINTRDRKSNLRRLLRRSIAAVIGKPRRTATIVLAAFVLSLALPQLQQACFALTIGLSESKDHPKGVEIPPESELNPAETVKPQPQSKTPSPGQQPSPSGQPSQQPKPSKQPPAPGEKKPYKGIFAAWEPFDKLMPLKTATISVSAINLLQDQQWMVNNSNYNGFVNYYIEGGKSIGFVKDLNVKMTSNRQNRKNLNSNKSTNVSGKIKGAVVTYARNSTLSNSGSDSSASTSINNSQKYNVNYQVSKRFSASFAADRNMTRSITSSAVTQTTDRRQAWGAKYQPGGNIIIEASQVMSANRNYISGAMNKTSVGDIKATMPISKRFTLAAEWQYVGNHSMTDSVTAGTETRKTSRIMTVGYQFSPDLKLDYIFTLADDRSHTSAIRTNIGTTSREMKFQYGIFPWLKFNGANQVSFSETSGKTAQRNGQFNIDHKKMRFAPGNTSVQINKKVTVTPSEADPNTTENYTLTINTPLNYMKNRLNLSHQYTLTDNSTSAIASENSSRSISHNYNLGYKLTKTLTLSETINRTDSENSTLDDITSQNANVTTTNKASYQIRKPFTKRIRRVHALEYAYSETKNDTSNYIPTYSFSSSNVIKNSGIFSLKDKKWQATYTVEDSISKPLEGNNAHALMHKIDWNFGRILGCKFIGNYSLTKQSGGNSVAGTIMKATKEIDNTMSLSIAYEFSKNQNDTTYSSNTLLKYFEFGAEFKY